MLIVKPTGQRGRTEVSETGGISFRGHQGDTLLTLTAECTEIGLRNGNITYSFIANCQTAVVHKNKEAKRRSEIYKSQYILRYSKITVRYSRNAVR